MVRSSKTNLFIRRQISNLLIACIGGGSNALGLFHEFLDDNDIEMIAVEEAERGINTDKHAASLSGGKPGVLHGNKTYLLQSDSGQIQTHSISAGLDILVLVQNTPFYLRKKELSICQQLIRKL